MRLFKRKEHQATGTDEEKVVLEIMEAALSGNAHADSAQARDITNLVEKIKAQQPRPSTEFIQKMDAAAEGFSASSAEREKTVRARVSKAISGAMLGLRLARPASSSPKRASHTLSRFPSVAISRRVLAVAAVVLLGAVVVVPTLLITNHRGQNAGSSAGSSSLNSMLKDSGTAVAGGSATGQNATGGAGPSVASPAVPRVASPGVPNTASPSTTGTPYNPSRQVQVQTQLQLQTDANKVQGVADKVFQVVGLNNGFVSTSNVGTGVGSASSASFQITVPRVSLQATLTELSGLADVVSRTQNTADITDAYNNAHDKLAELHAQHASLVLRLATATNTQVVAQLKQQLQLIDSEITAAASSFQNVKSHSDNSQITLSIIAKQPVVSSNSSGLGVNKALHQAGVILVGALSIVILALSFAFPVAALFGILLIAWMSVKAIRRRRREKILGE